MINRLIAYTFLDGVLHSLLAMAIVTVVMVLLVLLLYTFRLFSSKKMPESDNKQTQVGLDVEDEQLIAAITLAITAYYQSEDLLLDKDNAEEKAPFVIKSIKTYE